MTLQCADELLVRAEVLDEGIDLLAEFADLLLFRLQRGGHKNIVLVRAEVLLGDQLGHGDLRVDGPAQADVPFPFEGRDVERGRGGQGDDRRLAEILLQIGQAFPPFVPQVVGLVEHERLHAQLLEPLHDRVAPCGPGSESGEPSSAIAVVRAVESLVGGGGEEAGVRMSFDIHSGVPCRASMNRLTNRSTHWSRMATVGERISVGRFSAPHDLQAQHGLARARGRDDVQVVVIEVSSN